MDPQPPVPSGSLPLSRTMSVMARNAVETAIDDAVFYKVGLLLAIVVVARKLATAIHRFASPSHLRAKDIR